MGRVWWLWLCVCGATCWLGCSDTAAVGSCIVGSPCSCPVAGVQGMQRCSASGVPEGCACAFQAGTGAVPGAGGQAGAGGAAMGTGAMSGGGAGGMAGSAGPAVAVPEPTDEAAPLWDAAQLRTYALEIGAAELQQLNAAPAQEQYVPGTFIFEGTRYPVGVRYKGSVGAFLGCVTGPVTNGSKTCDKLSMKVSFNWNNPGGRFMGLKKLLLHSMNNDPSLMRERLGYWLFRQVGVAAPRAVHARLEINGGYAGLFAMVEQIDSRFTRAHFTDGGDGNLYKEIWPKWTNGSDYMPALKTNETDPELSFDRVVRFAQAVEAAADDTATFGTVSTWMDTDYLMRAVAVDRAIKNDDGMFHWYCGGAIFGNVATGNNPGPCSNHNFYWYEEQDADRLWFVPWDLDLAFDGETSGFVTILTEWDAEAPACPTNGTPGLAGSPNQLAPSCDKMTHSWGRQQAAYHDAVRALLAGPMATGEVAGRLQAWRAQIEGAVQEQEAAFGAGLHIPSAGGWNNNVTALGSFMDNRRQALQQLVQ